MRLLLKIYRFFFKKKDLNYYWNCRQKALYAKTKLRRTYNRHLIAKFNRKFGADISPSAMMKNMPNFPHGLFGIFISNGAVIGENCVIFHQVSIGSNTLPDSNMGTPTIGNNVFIGAGAKIIGHVRVGNNVRIGANCVIVKDVPDNCTVVLPPPRVIEHAEPRSNKMLSFSAARRMRPKVSAE